MTSKQRSRSAPGRRRARSRGFSASPANSPSVGRSKPTPAAVDPPPVAMTASEPLALRDDATWAAALNAAFTRLQDEVRQRAHSVLGGELARVLGASGQVAAALGRHEAPPAPEHRSEPATGKPARAAPAPALSKPSPAPSPQLTAPFLTDPIPAAPPAARSVARPARPAPDAPAPVAAVVRRRSAKLLGDMPPPAPSDPGADQTSYPGEPAPEVAQLTLTGLAPAPEASDADPDVDLDDATADDVEAGPADDAERERERRRDERREARMQRRQWRQERARQRRAEARMRQAAKQIGSGVFPAPGMRSPDDAAAHADAALPDASAPPRGGTSAASNHDDAALAAQAELALDSDDPYASDADAVEPAQATDGRKRIRWTRESIITELASFLVSGTVIDASFIERYGPPGLVAATRRVFGRFDAALNVAGLHVAKLYPDGPPAR